MLRRPRARPRHERERRARLDVLPSCFITDPSGLTLRNEIGIEIIAWECDYPHTDTTWPESPEWAWREFQAAG